MALPIAPIQGSSLTLPAATTAGIVTLLKPSGNAFRCGNRSTSWARIVISTDLSVIGPAGGATTSNLVSGGTQIPPNAFIDIFAPVSQNTYAAVWLESGTASTIVVESIRI